MAYDYPSLKHGKGSGLAKPTERAALQGGITWAEYIHGAKRNPIVSGPRQADKPQDYMNCAEILIRSREGAMDARHKARDTVAGQTYVDACLQMWENLTQSPIPFDYLSASGWCDACSDHSRFHTRTAQVSTR